MVRRSGNRELGAAGAAVLMALCATAALVAAEPAPRAVAMLTGLSGPGRLEVLRAPDRREPLAGAAGVRLCAGDLVRAAGGEVTLSLLHLARSSLVTATLAPGAARSAEDLLATPAPSTLGALLGGLTGFFKGPDRGLDRLGGALAGAVSAPTELGLDKAEVSPRDAPGGAGEATDSFSGSIGGGQPAKTQAVTAQVAEARPVTPPPPAQSASGGASKSLGDLGPPGAVVTGQTLDGQHREPPAPSARTPDTPQRSAESKKLKADLSQVARGRNGRAVPHGSARVVLWLPGLADGQAVAVVSDVTTQPPRVLDELGVTVREHRATLALGPATLKAPLGTRLTLCLFRGDQPLEGTLRWIVTVAPERLAELTTMVRRARQERSPEGRRALLLVAAELYAELGAAGDAALLYDTLLREPDLSPSDREAFAAALKTCTAALGR